MSLAARPPPPVRNAMVRTSLVGEADATSQAHERIAEGIQALERTVLSRSVVTVTLTAGSNVVTHGLGRVPRGATVTPTVADAGFAWAMTAADSKQVTIVAVGPTQPSATVEVY